MRTPARSAGAALVSAIVLIIVLAALGAAMMNLSNVEHDTATKSMLSTRVYYGAKTGLEWAIQQAISEPVATAPARCIGFSGGGTTFAPSAPGLSGVSVTVICDPSTHGAGNFTYYITSVARTGTAGSLSYAERQMGATVSNIP